MALIVRPARAADEDVLWEMLHLSLFVAPGEEDFPESLVRTEPRLASFVDGFGTEDGDHGSIAEEHGRPLGAAWARFVADGYGHVSDDIPELAVAVVADRRGEGIGGSLLAAVIAGIERTVPGLSLSCDERNPALRLYQRFGFEQVRFDEPHSVVMLRRFDHGHLIPMAPMMLR
jgi:GNAT superfamily N-acetyltransferase